MGQISNYLKSTFKHYNAAEVIRSAESLKQLLDGGGKLIITLAGAFSTGECGKVLAELIRSGKVHAICCTGANLEEDIFQAVAGHTHHPVINWRHQSPEQDRDLRLSGYNRVLDTAIHDSHATEAIEKLILPLWYKASIDLLNKNETNNFTPRYWYEYFYELIRNGSLFRYFESLSLPDDEAVCNSWVIAACEYDIPIFTPGYEDSTMGNVFTGRFISEGDISPYIFKTGIEAFADWSKLYRKWDSDGHQIGVLVLGGGIPGDFIECVVPMIHYDLEVSAVKHFRHCTHITDAVMSYGGYSGCGLNEKCSWDKCEPGYTDMFHIESDYTIVFPLISAIVLDK